MKESNKPSYEEKDALKSFVSGAGAIFIIMFVAYFITFLYKLIISRYYGPSDYGLYEMGITLLGLFSIIASLGLRASFIRFLPEYKNNKKEYSNGLIKSTFIIHLISSLLFSLFFIMFAQSITNFFGFPNKFKYILYIISFIIPIKVFRDNFTSILLSYKKTLISKSGSQIVYNICLIIGALIIFFFKLDILYLMVFLFFSYLITLIYYFYHYKKISHKFKTKSKKYEIRRWLSYSLPLLFAGLVGTIIGWSDNFVIGRILTQSEVGIYSIAFSVSYYLFIGSKMFSTLFLPVMTEHYNKNKKLFKRLFMTIRNWSILVSLSIGSVFILYANQILYFVFGSEYIEGASSLRVLSVFFIITNYFFFSSYILNLEEDTKKILYGDLITLILNLTITIYLVLEIGILGAAIGSGLSRLLIKFIFHLLSKKYVKIPHDLKYLTKSLILTFPSALFSYFVTNAIFRYSSIHFSLYVIFAGLIYVSLLLIGARYLSIFNEKDLVVIEMIETYTKLNLNFLKDFLIR